MYRPKKFGSQAEDGGWSEKVVKTAIPSPRNHCIKGYDSFYEFVHIFSEISQVKPEGVSFVRDTGAAIALWEREHSCSSESFWFGNAIGVYLSDNVIEVVTSYYGHDSFHSEIFAFDPASDILEEGILEKFCLQLRNFLSSTDPIQLGEK